jgi:GH15 family glucan-1,4-alpha-glucosidase
MVLATTVSGPGGEARILDCFALSDQLERPPGARLLRVVEGVRGHVAMRLDVSPRFDYGSVRPWLRFHGHGVHSAVGGSDGLLVYSDVELERGSQHDLTATFWIQAQQRIRLALVYTAPTDVPLDLSRATPETVDNALEATIRWWREWSREIRVSGRYAPSIVRSAIVLKALAHPRTGAIVAAATTSLPEEPGGTLNWDYRYSWVRDSMFSARALSDVGCLEVAEGFRRFIESSAAGAADDLQIMYGLGGERRLTEVELELEGYRGARPVRIGNQAAVQRQLDVFGEVVELTWRWHTQGNSPGDDYWRFLVDLVDAAAASADEPDRGLWESRGEPRHYVHSKVMLWVALDKGIRLAQECLRQAPVDRWTRARARLRRAIETRGFDQRRNTYVQAFGSGELDAALLLLPSFGYIEAHDPRMVGTVDAIRRELDSGGLLLRNRTEGLASGEGAAGGHEGSFIACTFWLAEVLAGQGRIEEAREAFERASATGNDLGLFAEEFNAKAGEMAGNFPQALTHLSHISAAVALTRLVAETPAEMAATP